MSATSTSEFIWFNGKLIPWQEANVHVMSHALHYGSSVFEGIRAYVTPNGTCIFRLKEHIDRLFNSAKIYRFPLAYTKEEIMEACKAVVRENKLESGYIRPLAFMGNVGLGLSFPKDAKADVMVGAIPWGAYLGEEGLQKGVRVGVSSWNRLAPNTIPTEAKAGGNYLSSILIANEAHQNGYDEAIALDVNGYVSEGSGENIFVIKDKVLYTAPFTCGLLPGITRASVITLARDLGYEVVEQRIPREMVYLADELFFSGTAAEITPIASVDGIDVGAGCRGPITKHIQETFFAYVKGESEDRHGWLTRV
ncbi:Branched-chain-amino-acid aminotransferase [Anaerobiospirillum thomasii]|uniref:Branched-chain-amino-acid aminotransferase n=1 Tax=Anaerobiospirillum thomasii TaxID=179995 RepID=A0A2X0VG20_9GAMM|nr:branched-chain amino acid transaminase [Anaerobiospirillum thomasii]SPT69252.1 Branched-chain-amino-acid aminotransferase [Anaerobiospirillum thomasii]SPT72186.1 Branched-chain-amino-acid aminotransferase [Anaerobiospirillum thomasii]